MLILKLAWRNLVRHYKKSLLLSTLILIGIALLFLANSIFQGTNDGLEKTFIGSFTGDIVISSDSGGSFSLFGNEVPLVSDLETIPPLYSHQLVLNILDEIPEIEAVTSIVSVPSSMVVRGVKITVPLFGVDPETYFDVCSDIVLEIGESPSLLENGVFINSVLVKELELKLDSPLEIGENISFSMFSGNSFRIRTAPFLGIHKYGGSIEALDHVVLADLTTVRSLVNYTLGYTSESSDSVILNNDEDSFNLDNLFSENTDVTGRDLEEFDFQSFEENLSNTESRDSLVLTDSGAWSFILIKAREGERERMIKRLKSVLNQSDLDVRLMSWRTAAGSTAMILFAVQSLFYVGLGFLGIGIILVIMNALVFSVLERTGEIGTMRSLGATPGFIRSLFMLESMIITIGGAILGIVIGCILVISLKITNFQLSNPILISLFGGASISPVLTWSSVVSHILIAGLLGALAWVYPVSLAMKIQPITAIDKV